MSGSTLERSEDNGQFTSDTDEKILAAMPPNEPVRARDIADETDIPRTTVNYNLNKLADAGEGWRTRELGVSGVAALAVRG
jgi:predicted ArsR family transcriptional regulator